ncbi:putative methyltransferase [Desulforapulum autotrophicum HRM2]|uniref:Methyltransferase n=1 Tax=Desulforapulum autotrophicum (strain ATCC 43914 / DSM 3382 / VKM B-1955 / HRM2) TaxID=177437 RepID=C0QB08_DESAH|nr:class I SAM-dependent methyltransferase [Desulforapulum autotrophicum]ACN14807.1 putative methyltransferase [Desulforapulum autotrophicum HRM2]
MITLDFKRLDLKPGQKILDIGCGEGRHTAQGYEQGDTFCVGADRNPKDLLTSKTKLELHQQLSTAKGSSWSLAAADITRLPFCDAGFDTVICSEVMEHIPDEKKAIAEIIRVLKPGGTLGVSVPRYWPEAICWWLSHDYHNVNQGHIRIYKKNDLIAKIVSQGMGYRGFHHAHSLHSPFWWLKCLVGPTRTDAWCVNLYHRFLVWDLMEKPLFTKMLDRILNPVMGKSLALYFQKNQD